MEQQPEQPRVHIEKSQADKDIKRVKGLFAQLLELELKGIKEPIEEFQTFTSMLEERYPNIRDYSLFHTLISSTPAPGQELIYDDLPGEDSILAFVAKMEAKYLK